MADFTVSLLYPSDDYVFSYVSPGCVLYQWNAIEKKISNRLDCSKLVPCSESLNSISIEEHLSPGKCQITAMCKLDTHLYVGTSWGCIVVIETDSLRPITIFRPFEEEVFTITLKYIYIRVLECKQYFVRRYAAYYLLPTVTRR